MSIELRQVDFTYPTGHRANIGISLHIDAGERLAIIGENGAGKTTAVKLMNGLHRPSAGAVLIDGEDVRDRSCAQISRKVGYVFQNSDDQIFNSTVRAEIEYVLKYMKLPKDEIERRVEEVASANDIAEFLDENPLDLPYPIRKFVTLAAVMATRPTHIILDEPTAGQDSQRTSVLESILDRLAAEGIAVVTISHDMEFVARNFGRVVVMAHAQTIFDGPPSEVFDRQELLDEAGICRPQMAEVGYRLGLTGSVLLTPEDLMDAVVTNGQVNS